MIVSNIGVTPDLSAIYTPNSGMHTAFVQVSLKEEHSLSSFEYMKRVRAKLASDLPEVQTYFQSGGLVDSIVNQGLPAPFDIQVSSNNMEGGYAVAQQLAQKFQALHGVSDVLIPQDIDYPGLALNIDRQKASLEGLTPKTIVDSVITAMTSNGQVAPSYWIDPKTGNNYMLTVQYPETQVQTLNDFKQIPLRSADGKNTTPLETVASIKAINTPTEVDHYQLRRVFDVYVMPKAENLSTISGDVQKIVKDAHPPHGTVLTVRGSVNNMNESFRSFAIGLILSIVLVFLILMAQFASFVDPFIILLAIPPGISGVILFLLLTHTTLNIMSLMGVLMMTGIVVSDSILIVEFVGQLRSQGLKLEEAIITACKVRLRPILMTTLATVLGLDPNGSRSRGWKRAIRSACPRDSWRTDGLRCCDGVSGAERLPAHPQTNRGTAGKRECCCAGGTRVRSPLSCFLIAVSVVSVPIVAVCSASRSPFRTGGGDARTLRSATINSNRWWAAIGETAATARQPDDSDRIDHPFGCRADGTEEQSAHNGQPVTCPCRRSGDP